MKIEADLVVFNGNIITMDPAQPMATTLAIKNFKFLAVGKDEHIEDLLPTARRVIDLGGKTALPGFVDAHTHITVEGIRASHVRLSDAKSIAEVQALLREAVPRHAPGQWIRGYGWDESRWSEKRYITASDLDAVSRDHPIAVDRVDMHLTSVNTTAMQQMAIPDQEGVLKDAKGRPIGVYRDVADVHKALYPTADEVRRGVVAATRIANVHGITTAVDNIQPGTLRLIRECETSNELTARLVVNIRDKQMEHLIKLGITSGMGSPMVRIGGVKSFIDGSIGARTAAVSEPYKDDRKNKGRLLTTPRALKRLVTTAVHGGLQTAIHAIGDAAIEMLIATFESLSDDERSLMRAQRHRIEHAEMISEDQIRRATALGLILSMQPNFVVPWQLEGGLYYDRFEDDRVDCMNMFRVALDNGARVCFGSDGMPYGPLYGIWAAATHPNPKVRLSVEEALRCYTVVGAYASFMERIAGSITVGKRADFVVLSDNILRTSPSCIKDIVVENTFVGGIEEFSVAKNR
ncbi:MAG: amidohydrolase [Candidatus Thorarchaeota archaeon]|nr:amidohydrolase [Candidatus Thorarchaeota archaeon]